MSAGTYEGGIVEDVKLLDRYFTRAHIRHRTVYTPAGHNFGTWRHLTPAALTYFLAPDASLE